MKRLLACAAAGLTFFGVARADTLQSHTPIPDTRFSDALGVEDQAIEFLLNARSDADRGKSAQKKTDVKDKAFGTLFGTMRNNTGAGVCGLVLANGTFMFSCSPAGAYSIDTVTDGSGLITLFGFADGHFPSRTTLGSFGRFDVTLNLASSTVQPPPAANSTITFNITDGCNNGLQIEYKFYDVSDNLVWPSATSHYFTEFLNATYRHDLLCSTGAKVCYGARSGTFYWGIDEDGTKACADCCIFCQQGNSLSPRLTC